MSNTTGTLCNRTLLSGNRPVLRQLLCRERIEDEKEQSIYGDDAGDMILIIRQKGSVRDLISGRLAVLGSFCCVGKHYYLPIFNKG